MTPCALHDAQNSLKWSMYSEFNDQDKMRDIYVAISSRRNSHDLLSSRIDIWVGKSIRFAEDRGAEWVQRWRAVWLALGVDVETRELLVSELQLHWDGAFLWVLRGAFEDGDVMDAASSALRAVWRFQKFTESRWLTVGTSARSLVAALLTGIEDMVKVICSSKHTSKFYIKGFSRLDESRKQFLATAAIVGRVPEAFQLELMQDNRVARSYDHLYKVLSEELKWVIDIPLSIFTIIGSMCGRTGEAQRELCISASHIAYQFMWRRVLVPANEYPWSLVRGNISENLEFLALDGTPCPDEPVAEKVWMML